MTPEWLNALASIATLIVVTLTAYAALRQLSHLRAGNQVSAMLPLMEEYQSAEIQASLNYIRSGTMARDLQNADCRAGLMQIPSVGPAREAQLCMNFYEHLGALICAGVLDLELILSHVEGPADMWKLSSDYIAIVRRSRGATVFEEFEALVLLERDFEKRNGASRFPKNLKRIDLVDSYAADDGVVPVFSPSS